MASSSEVASTVAEVYRAILTDMPASSEVFVAGLAEEPTAALVAVLAIPYAGSFDTLAK